MPTDLSRSALTILIPGAVAVAPWLLALVQYTRATLGFDSYTSLGNLVLFGAAAVVGTILQEFGSFVEVRWDREREDALAVHENWYSYLSRILEHEPVGYRYLSRLATTLYFELSMMFATPTFLAGATLLAMLRFPGSRMWIVIAGIVTLGVSVLFFRWQARETHKTLCETRRELNKRLTNGG
ncbi:MAG: hypothetical protein ABI779_05470 [Acidobacteriota bacterium]